MMEMIFYRMIDGFPLYTNGICFDCQLRRYIKYMVLIIFIQKKIMMQNEDQIFLWTYIFLRSAKIQLLNDVKMKIIGAFNKKLLFFVFIFLHIFIKNLNKNYYENIVLCNTIAMVPNLLTFYYKQHLGLLL